MVNNVNLNIINFMERQLVEIQGKKAGAIATAQAEYYKTTTSKEIASLETEKNKLIGELTAKYNSDVAELNAEHDANVSKIKERDNGIIASQISVAYEEQIETINKAIEILRG